MAGGQVRHPQWGLVARVRFVPRGFGVGGHGAWWLVVLCGSGGGVAAGFVRLVGRGCCVAGVAVGGVGGWWRCVAGGFGFAIFCGTDRFDRFGIRGQVISATVGSVRDTLRFAT